MNWVKKHWLVLLILAAVCLLVYKAVARLAHAGETILDAWKRLLGIPGAIVKAIQDEIKSLFGGSAADGPGSPAALAESNPQAWADQIPFIATGDPSLTNWNAIAGSKGN